jgi:hypothetical protein
MQTPNANTQLAQAAADLARFAPEHWAKFIEAMSVFSDHHKDNLVRSPVDALQGNQGRAAILATLTDNLRDCIKNADATKGTK